MVFNADKTKLIWFSLKTPDVKEQPILVFEDEDVSFSFEPVKDLGFLFGSTLPWTLHIEKKYMMPMAVLSISKEVSQSLSQAGICPFCRIPFCRIPFCRIPLCRKHGTFFQIFFGKVGIESRQSGQGSCLHLQKQTFKSIN